MQRYVFEDKLLGPLHGDHFLCELMPLPKPDKCRIEPYGAIWPSVQQYRRQVAPARRRLVLDTLKNHSGVEAIVTYERDIEDLFLKGLDAERLTHWTLFKGQHYVLWRLCLGHDRVINLLQAPFFGQGQVSYQGIWESVRRLVEFGAGKRLQTQ